MAAEKLYELAFAYKKTKLWKRMFDTELFAVRLPDGETGYCCVMGTLGDHIALAVYVGEAGIQSWRTIAFHMDEVEEEGDFLNYQTLLFSQDCLQCAFETKDQLTPEELEETRLYARDHRMSLRGANAFPHFIRYAPYRYPWHLENRAQERQLCEALDAAIALSDMLREHSKQELGLLSVTPETETIPLLVRKKGGFVLDVAPLPPERPLSYPTPKTVDPEAVGRVRALRRSGILECEIIHIPDPVQEGDEAPSFPVLLLCVDTKSHMPLPVVPVIHYQEEPELLLNTFVEALEQKGICPRAVRVRNEATRCILLDFCMEAGILLSVDENLSSLDGAREEFLSFLYNVGGDEDDDYDDDDEDDDRYDAPFGHGGMLPGDLDIFQALLDMPDQELRQMPRALAKQLLDLADQGLVPSELERRLRRLFR